MLGPAQAFGMIDRGALLPGLRADINVIDMNRLSLAPPKAEYDLPEVNTARCYVASGITKIAALM
jgi:N-acyl-D-aspartate/D-glutamate deacylase